MTETEKLDTYVQKFVSICEERLSEKFQELEGHIRKAGKTAEAVTKCLDTASGATEVLPEPLTKLLVQASFGLLGVAASEIGKSYNRRQLKKLISLLYSYDKKPQAMRLVLVEAAVEIFVCYQQQLLEVTADGKWEYGMRKCAEDAVTRFLQFFTVNNTEAINCTPIDVTHGVVQCVAKQGHTVDYNNIKWEAHKMYSNAGLVKLDANGAITGFYKSHLTSKPEKYAYRLPFRWEENEQYEKIGKENKKLTFKLKKCDMSQHVMRNFKEINANDPKLMEERLQGGVTVAKAELLVKSDENCKKTVDAMEKGLDEVKKKIEEYTQRFFSGEEGFVKPYRTPLGYGVKRPVERFSGRTKQLSEIYRLLGGDCKVVLTGVGGVGKSELARKYIHEHQNDYDGNIVWFSCQNLDDSFEKFAKDRLHMTEIGGASSVAEEIYEILENERVLFIFDEAQDHNAIEPYLPFKINTSHKFLITSNISSWESARDNFKTISVTDLLPADACEYIKTALAIPNEAQDKIVEELAKAMGYLPLALEQATSFIKSMEKGYTIADYLKTFKENPECLLTSDSTSTGANRTIIRNFKISLENLKKAANFTATAKILSILAYLAPNEIPRKIFLHDVANDKPEQLQLMLIPLMRYSIVNEEKGMLNIHRLNQMACRLLCPSLSSEEEVLDLTLKILSGGYNQELNNHVISVWDHAYKYPKLIKKYIVDRVGIAADVPNSLGMIIDGEKMHLVEELVKQIPNHEFKNIMTKASVWIKNMNFQLVKLLCSKGVDENYRSSGNLSLLHMAAFVGDLDAVTFLVKQRKMTPSLRSNAGFTPLHNAAQNGRNEVIKFFLNDNTVNLNEKSRYSFTPLHSACANGQLETVKLLLSRGADLMATDYVRETCAHHAGLNGHIEILKYLIDKRDELLHVKTSEGLSLLHLSARNNHDKIVKYLLDDKKTEIDTLDHTRRTAAHYAAENNHFDLLKELVKRKANVSAVAFGETSILHSCAKNGHMDIVKYLLMDQKVNSRPVDYKGREPLHMASGNGHLEICEYLIEKHGCNALAKDKYDWVPLHYAAKNGSVKTIDYLISKTMCVDPIAKDGRTPLHIAIENCNIDAAQRLIDSHGANKYIKDGQEMGLIHMAASAGYIQMIKSLIEGQHAKVDETIFNGETALHMAARNGQLATVQYLIDKEYAKIQRTTLENDRPRRISVKYGNKGSTPLLLAALSGQISIVKYLIENQVEKRDVVDDRGWNSLHYAARYSHLEIVKYLIEEAGSDVTILQNEGYNAVHLAVRNHYRLSLETVEYLSGLVTDTTSKVNGWTILHAAAAHGSTAIVKWLIENRKINPSAAAHGGFTPLHLAAQNKNVDVCEYLVEKLKCNPTQTNDNGLTALDLAKKTGNEDVIKYLKSLAEGTTVEFSLF